MKKLIIISLIFFMDSFAAEVKIQRESEDQSSSTSGSSVKSKKMGPRKRSSCLDCFAPNPDSRPASPTRSGQRPAELMADLTSPTTPDFRSPFSMTPGTPITRVFAKCFLLPKHQIRKHFESSRLQRQGASILIPVIITGEKLKLSDIYRALNTFIDDAEATVDKANDRFDILLANYDPYQYHLDTAVAKFDDHSGPSIELERTDADGKIHAEIVQGPFTVQKDPIEKNCHHICENCCLAKDFEEQILEISAKGHIIISFKE